jgi:hypothetical protein
MIAHDLAKAPKNAFKKFAKRLQKYAIIESFADRSGVEEKRC